MIKDLRFTVVADISFHKVGSRENERRKEGRWESRVHISLLIIKYCSVLAQQSPTAGDAHLFCK